MTDITMEEFKRLFPYCIPEQWRVQMALFGKDDWSLIPIDLRDTITKIFETDFPWEKTPMRGARRIWLNSEFKLKGDKNE